MVQLSVGLETKQGTEILSLFLMFTVDKSSDTD
jgi:hypothetical protein